MVLHKLKEIIMSNSKRITKDHFEDTLFDPSLSIVEKQHQSKFEHVTSVYVYSGTKAVRVLTRIITDEGTTFTEENL